MERIVDILKQKSQNWTEMVLQCIFNFKVHLLVYDLSDFRLGFRASHTYARSLMTCSTTTIHDWGNLSQLAEVQRCYQWVECFQRRFIFLFFLNRFSLNGLVSVLKSAILLARVLHGWMAWWCRYVRDELNTMFFQCYLAPFQQRGISNTNTLCLHKHTDFWWHFTFINDISQLAPLFALSYTLLCKRRQKPSIFRHFLSNLKVHQ